MKRQAILVAGIGMGLLSMSLLAVFQDDQPTTTASGPTGMSEADQIRFHRGRELFDKTFHEEDGLGTPELNSDSCRGCHQDPVLGGAGGLELNVSRFGSDNGGMGPFMDLPGGQGLSKLRPPYVDGREEYNTATADVFEQRQTPSILGAGLVETIPDHVIRSNEDPTDANGDGIFGVARMIDVGTGLDEVGRFGWKAQVPRVIDFVRDAMGGECGITTPDGGRGFALVSDSDNVADPELTEAEVRDMDFFLRSLPAPQRTGSMDPLVLMGEGIFDSIGCTTCHIPELLGLDGPVPLYSNLLLHDVMPPDFRGMAEPGADVGFFKTPPLWGIKDTAPYMHDGRAETLADAILAHHGEALAVRTAYENLSPSEQEAVVAFLEDL